LICRPVQLAGAAALGLAFSPPEQAGSLESRNGMFKVLGQMNCYICSKQRSKEEASFVYQSEALVREDHASTTYILHPSSFIGRSLA